jgi:hypothetical protein
MQSGEIAQQRPVAPEDVEGLAHYMFGG